MDSTPDIAWVATLSNGTTAVEHVGDYKIIEGARKPWVRLTYFLADNDLYLTSLRLNFRGSTIHMPRAKFDRFGLGEYSRTPLNYSLEYKYEADLDENGMEEKHYIDLISHFEGFEVHSIHDLMDGNTSWVVVTEGHTSMAPSPKWQ